MSKDNLALHLHSTLDGEEWARAFCQITGFQDEALALAWFANALTTGYDIGRNKKAQARPTGLIPDAD
jgi:hypothetical protein